jgi:glycosyltransferase involved in cell wall biosynthesis
MITVCHIVNLITGKADGVYTHLKMIFENSDQTKFQHLLIYQGGEKVKRELTTLGVQVFVSESLKKKISIRAFWDIYHIAKKNNVDIIHTHLVKPYAIAGLVNIILRKKFIFNYHGIFLTNNPYYNVLEKLIYQLIHYLIYSFGNVDAVIVPSRKSKELLLKETGLFSELIVYYNGYNQHSVSISDSTILGKIQSIKAKGNIIAMVARLEIQKRIDKALNLFKMVQEKQKNIFLLIFGDGDLKPLLFNRTKDLDLNSKVIFFDYVDNVVLYYQFFDILLFTSDWEGMPLSMWEAMANGVPVVAPNVGGFEEILQENNCGLIYKSDNLKDAEDKVLQIIRDEKLRKILEENGKRAIETIYNEKNFIRQIEQVYLNLLSS